MFARVGQVDAGPRLTGEQIGFGLGQVAEARIEKPETRWPRATSQEAMHEPRFEILLAGVDVDQQVEQGGWITLPACGRKTKALTSTMSGRLMVRSSSGSPIIGRVRITRYLHQPPTHALQRARQAD